MPHHKENEIQEINKNVYLMQNKNNTVWKNYISFSKCFLKYFWNRIIPFNFKRKTQKKNETKKCASNNTLNKGKRANII